MKVHSKMMVSSSPGRPEKLVALQFTKLLRGKGGSLSRGRSLSQSRSSPIFVTRRRSCNGSSSAVEISDGKDPGSPKVTCMGQVRIKKKKMTMKKLGTSASSSSMSSKKQERNRGNQQCCRCLNGSALFWNPFSTGKSTVTPPPSSPTMLRRWIWSSCSWSYQKPMQKGEDSGGDDFVISLDRFGSTTGGGNERVQQPEDAEEKEPVVAAAVEEKEVFVLTTPPKNALLLMRCRSAPHHSSPLITAFSAQKEIDPIGEITGKNKRSDSREAPGDGGKENIINLKNREVGTAPSSDENRRSEEDDKEEEASMAAIGPTPSFSSRPLILTKCKSEPAKKTARLPPVETKGSCFWTISSSTGDRCSGKNNRSSWSTSCN